MMDKSDKKTSSAVDPAAEEPVDEKKSGTSWEGAVQDDVPPPPPPPPPPPADPVAAMQDEIASLQAKYLYLQAEYQNYRKRVAKDLAETRSLTAADTLSPFLTVFDYLSMAETAADQSENVDAIRQGLKMIIAEFFKAFDELNVKPFDAVGSQFDPALHDAVAHENSETAPDGTVIKQWSRGFKLGERLLRPARVVVSSGPAAPQSEIPDPPEPPVCEEEK